MTVLHEAIIVAIVTNGKRWSFYWVHSGTPNTANVSPMMPYSHAVKDLWSLSQQRDEILNSDHFSCSLIIF